MLDAVVIAVDLDQVLQIAVFLIIIISSLAGQFFKGNAQRKKVARPPGEPAADADRPRLESEIEAMLRRAVGAEPAEKSLPELGTERKTTRTLNMPQPVVAAEVVEVVPEKRESVSEYVSRHMETEGFKRRPTHLAADISRADERLESRLHKTFDHKLGQLNTSFTPIETVTTQPPSGVEASPLASRVVEMLRSPDDLPAAILLNEILRRPEW